MEELTLMVTQDTCMRGLQPADSGEMAKVTAFVDDTATFLRSGKEIHRVRHLLEVFESLSGLNAQPAKCIYVCLNKHIRQKEHGGFPVFQPGATTRYLGVQVGLASTGEQTWEAKVAALRAKLAVAASSRLSVTARIKILNAIMLPAILFSAQFSRPSEAMMNRLVNLQRQFLWRSKLSTESSWHKIAPALLHTGIKQRGHGRVSIPMAVKAQAMRSATRWHVADQDIYRSCWELLIRLGEPVWHQGTRMSPLCTAAHSSHRVIKQVNILGLGMHWLREDLTALEERPAAGKRKRRLQSGDSRTTPHCIGIPTARRAWISTRTGMSQNNR